MKEILSIRKIRDVCNVRKTGIVTIMVNIVLKHLLNGFLHSKQDHESTIKVLFTVYANILLST